MLRNFSLKKPLQEPETPAGSDLLEGELDSDTPGRILIAKASGNIGFLVGTTILVIAIFTALFAPLIAPYDPYAQDFSNRLLAPFWQESGSWAYPLGTDRFGRDYLSRLIYGAQISLMIGLSVMIVSALIGTTLGLLAGYMGGWVDNFIMYLITVRLSMPVVLIALAVVSVVGSSLEVIIIVLGLFLWDRFAVVIRTSTQRLRNQEFIIAARAMGSSDLRIILQDIIPNLSNQLIVIATLEMAQAILLESALSFLGIGVQPPSPSWGLMIAEAKEYVFFDPWLITIPGTALFVLVLGINLLGDGIRDITTPEKM